MEIVLLHENLAMYVWIPWQATSNENQAYYLKIMDNQNDVLLIISIVEWDFEMIIYTEINIVSQTRFIRCCKHYL